MATVNEKGQSVQYTGAAGGVAYTQPQQGTAAGGQQQVVLMPKPNPIPGVPTGLEYLSQIDQLLIHQQIEIFELITGWETKNKYQIKNSVGQQVYFAMEESGMCMRQCCGGARGFTLHITDNFGQEVVRVNREFKCCAGCCWCAFSGCCQMLITVEAPVGTIIGSAVQQCSKCEPKFDIMDASDNVIFSIEGPCCMCQACCCPADLDFVISAPNGQEIGKISKQWTGVVQEMFTKANNFGVTFPADLDVRMKAVLLGTVFLIDFMYFEINNNNN